MKNKEDRNMRKTFIVWVLGCMFAACQHQPQWQLAWEENFEGKQLDTAVWSMIPKGHFEKKNSLSSDERCYELCGGQLILRGIVNEDLQKDSSAYLSGGIWTKGKQAFRRGRMEVRAKMDGVQGAWPAIWMLPSTASEVEWPRGGEVDIMERLNHDTFVYQTVHSYYTHNLKEKDNPPNGAIVSIRPDEFNVYGVDFFPDSLVFHVNGVKTFAYPRIDTDKEGQFPFDMPQYLLIDMQLGGTWVGEVDPTGLPVEMAIDWVKYYELK